MVDPTPTPPAATQAERHELIIDTDVGIDDATAILVAFQHPAADIKAFTIVDGNVDQPQAVKNIKTLCAVAKREDIPIYAGADGPILRGLHKKELWPGHGDDGLGNITTNNNNTDDGALALPGDGHIPTQKEVAAAAIVRMVNERPGAYTIVAVGPLTNIGIALTLDTELLTKIKGLYIMGGCLFGKGNANRAAEFNIHCDPEAAHIVFQAASTLPPRPTPIITLLTWELTVEHGFPWSFFDYLTQDSPVNAHGKFLRTMSKCAETLSRAQHELLGGPGPTTPTAVLVEKEELGVKTDEKTGKKVRTRNTHEEYLYGANSFLMPDLYAVAALLEPTSVTSYKDWDVGVELNGIHTRGMTHMDWWGGHGKGRTGPNARVVLAMDREVVKEMLVRTFKTGF
ncbi:Inosine/uridine-preferring nucleoside hydrolase domain-containing protein [Fimicolochytrium jonesii]|uniref:Inosine/uridine-preferring nucleoside hydrolase domain-containing protein n=1 Tax=Fimicolochytrium jonesii TaxID=1396493 RepID=UPI0022FECD02|nr:Inosine/uridine-preferring nucleoside hydrolase domain-containing protein [Fimicolochytrium jonesii]KAI8819253.1 Inosine/uridine-preferring nucleoside hydrolase domain-containing protein [Fimicolochytrium jonesii]